MADQLSNQNQPSLQNRVSVDKTNSKGNTVRAIKRPIVPDLLKIWRQTAKTVCYYRERETFLRRMHVRFFGEGSAPAVAINTYETLKQSLPKPDDMESFDFPEEDN